MAEPASWLRRAARAATVVAAKGPDDSYQGPGSTNENGSPARAIVAGEVMLDVLTRAGVLGLPAGVVVLVVPQPAVTARAVTAAA